MVKPELEHIAAPSRFSDDAAAEDRFLLGYVCIRVGMAIRQSARYAVRAETRGRVLILALHQLFGRRAPTPVALQTLLRNDPPDLCFTSGAHAALAAQTEM